MVSLEVIRDPEQFYSMRQEWNYVVEKSGIINPFLSHEWLCAWWKNYNNNKKLFVICFKKDGRFVGFVPLMEYKTKLARIPIRAIGFISNHWTPMDIILYERHESCLNSLTDLFLSIRKNFILAQMDCESGYFLRLKRILKSKNIDFDETTSLNARILLNGSWDEYLKNQTRNFRMDFKRKMKRLEKVGRVTLVRDLKDSEYIVKQLCAVSEKSWQGKGKVSLIETKEGKAFYEEIIDELLIRGVLDFSFLQVDDKSISYLVGVKSGDSYFAFDTAYDREFQIYSPGMLVHNLLLEKLFNSSVKRFDFGNTADYKSKWANNFRAVSNLTIFPKNYLGNALSFVAMLKKVSFEKKEIQSNVF